MDASTITKLVALLESNPGLKEKLMSLTNINDAVALIKSKGLEIAAKELQEYMTKNFANSDLAKSVLGKLAGDKSGLAGAAGDLLKGILG